eukprot:Sspe_Gene.56400::Locus_31028_Transcript_1_1_Confidence_1.000_Length_2012::g.56400::m.56400/K03462/NAMPT; nicotinamide phosphoribosyltransferase
MAPPEKTRTMADEEMQYLRDRNIPQMVEELVRHLVATKADDPVGTAADFFATMNPVPFAVPRSILPKRTTGSLGLDNFLLLTDSYKVTHFKQYPPKTTVVYSYFESRGGKYTETVFFGLQYFLKKHLAGVVVTPPKIDEAERILTAHLPPGSGFNRLGWEHIWNKHGGRLPLRIKAVPEGTVLPTRNVLITVENTDPECYWLTNYVETLLVQVWYPMTVATHSRACKKLILDNLKATGDPAGIPFKLHDFGFRGVSSVETAGIGGCAHLVNFLGTDTVAALTVARDYYGAKVDATTGTCPGFSIPASEHSTMTAWGRDREVDAMENMLTQYPEGLVACVSDSYDIFKACSDLWGGKLKSKVLNRNGTLVIRPDSGDVCEVAVKIFELLEEAFGAKTNELGYKVLDEHVRVIWGDGIDYESLGTIVEHLKEKGWSGDNIAFGSGGGLLQKLHRDTQKCAFKCSYACVDGKEIDVFKDPITDPGKVSKKGRLTLHRNDKGEWETKTGGT